LIKGDYLMKTSIIAAAILSIISISVSADNNGQPQVQNNLDVSGVVSAGMGGTIASVSKTDLQGINGSGVAADMGTATLAATARSSLNGLNVTTDVQGAASSSNEASLDAKGLTTGLANGVSAGLGIGSATGSAAVGVELPEIPALPTIVIE
jgi:hypothetical protein